METELDEIDETDDESVVEAEEPGVDEAEVAKSIVLEEVRKCLYQP